METLTVANQKGGVGKTTCAFHLAVALGLRGYRVLAVDLDPQAHLTLACRWRPSDVTAYEVLSRKVETEDAIQPSVHGIDLIGSDQLLARYEGDHRFDERSSLATLTDALSAISARYEFCVVDTPPSLGLLSCLGLAAANGGVLVPLIPEAYALKGLQRLLTTIDEISHITPGCRLHSIVPSMVRNRWVSHRKLIEALPDLLDRETELAPSIPSHGAVAIASALRTSVFACAPKTTVATAYAALADFVAESCEELLDAS